NNAILPLELADKLKKSVDTPIKLCKRWDKNFNIKKRDIMCQELETPYVTTRISVTQLLVYPEPKGTLPSIKKNFIKSSLTKEKRKNPGLNTAIDSVKICASTMKALLIDIALTVAQARIINSHTGLSFSKKLIELIKAEVKSLINQEALDFFLAKKNIKKTTSSAFLQAPAVYIYNSSSCFFRRPRSTCCEHKELTASAMLTISDTGITLELLQEKIKIRSKHNLNKRSGILSGKKFYKRSSTSKPGFYSFLFTITKKAGGLRPVLDLRYLNKYVAD
ncbi:hypothetical protein BB561_006975, partial [Smittium simulii]